MTDRTGEAPSGPQEPGERPWYAGGLRFQCIPGCTRCCTGTPGDVFVSDEEVRAIAAFLKTDESEFRAACVRPAPGDRQGLRERANGDCVLLDRQGCSVYAVRPVQCRAFPFWPEIIESPDAWELQARKCPGMNEGPLHAQEEIEVLAERDRRRGRSP